MTQLLRQISLGSKFAAQFGGVVTLSAVSVAALTLTGTLKLQWAQPQMAAAALVATGLVAGAWSWLVGRTAARPLKEAVALAQTLSEATGPVPFAVDRGDEATRLLRHLTHVQEQHQSLARSYDELKAEQEDLSDELAHWATDTLRMRSALDATGVRALLTDEDGVILFVTKTLAALLKEHEVKIKTVLPQVDLGRLIGQRLDVFSQAAEGADLAILPTSEGETELRFAGLTLALLAQPIRDRQGQIVGHTVTWRDLSASLTSPVQTGPATVAAEAAPWRQILDLSVLPSYVAAPDGRILMANAALRQLLADRTQAFKAANPAFQAQKLEGASVAMFYGASQDESVGLKNLSDRRVSRRVLGGRTFDITDTPVRNEAGQVVAVLSQWQDCTDAWLASHAFAALAVRVSEGDYARPASLEGMQGLFLDVGTQLNAVVAAMNQTVAPVRAATEQLGTALAQVSQSTLSVQEVLQSLARKPAAERAVPKATAMLAEKAGAVLAQMVPAINHTSELLQDPMNPEASEALASTAEQLQAQAALLQAMVASYRLAVGAGKATRPADATESEAEPLISA